jgi:hypothetical protein
MDFLPQKRYDPNVYTLYFGFHQTKPEFAASIAQTGFRISSTPPHMLGFGIYFARIFASTIGKACAEG